MKRRISAACRDLDHRHCHVKGCVCKCHQRTVLTLDKYGRPDPEGAAELVAES